MPNPMKKQVAYIHLDTIKNANYEPLKNHSSIDEWYINENEQLLIVKYDKDSLNEEQIKALLANEKA
jgi:hypothetical protein